MRNFKTNFQYLLDQHIRGKHGWGVKAPCSFCLRLQETLKCALNARNCPSNDALWLCFHVVITTVKVLCEQKIKIHNYCVYFVFICFLLYQFYKNYSAVKHFKNYQYIFQIVLLFMISFASSLQVQINLIACVPI